MTREEKEKFIRESLIHIEDVDPNIVDLSKLGGGIRMGNYLEGVFWLLELLMKLIWILPLLFLGLGIGIGYLIWG